VVQVKLKPPLPQRRDFTLFCIESETSRMCCTRAGRLFTIKATPGGQSILLPVASLYLAVHIFYTLDCRCISIHRCPNPSACHEMASISSRITAEESMGRTSLRSKLRDPTTRFVPKNDFFSLSIKQDELDPATTRSLRIKILQLWLLRGIATHPQLLLDYPRKETCH
jgi:hypothetical protein